MDPILLPGYSVSQTPDTITIYIKLTGDTHNLDYRCHDQKICVKYANEPPLLCGKLLDQITKDEHNIVGDEIIIILRKSSPGEWPILIIDEADSEIDGKSAFVLGRHLQVQEEFDKAWTFYKRSQQLEYLHAQIFVVDQYMSKNSYFTDQNFDEAEKIIRSMPMTVDVALRKSTLLAADDPQKAIEFLRSQADKYPECLLELAKMQSPIVRKGTDPTGAVENFEKLLERQRNPEALHFLALHKARGCGTKKDKVGGKLLNDEARVISPTIPLDEEEFKENYAPLIAVCAVAVSAVAAITFMLTRRKR